MTPSPATTWRLALRLSQHEPRMFWRGFAAWVTFFASIAGASVLVQRAFGMVDGSGSMIVWVGGAIVLVEIARATLLTFGAQWFTETWVHIVSLARSNMLASQLTNRSTDAGLPTASAGGALTHFREEADDVMQFIDSWFDITGTAVFAVIALVLMAAIDPIATAAVIVPMVGVIVLTWLTDAHVKRYRRESREAASAVSGLLGDTLSASLTVQVNGATAHVHHAAEQLLERRRHTAVRDTVLGDGLFAISSTIGDLSFGLVLLVSASRVRSGELTATELALFVALLADLWFFPRMAGLVMTRRRQTTVALERMAALVADEDPRHIAARRPTSRTFAPATVARRVLPDRVPLRALEVDGVGATLDANGSGVASTSFRIERGELVVITGEIGTGKTTLLRAILGLVDDRRPGVTTFGEVRWNGRVIDHPSEFLVPPNAAWLPQVPSLVSDTIADNVLLGWPDPTGELLAAALAGATVDGDVAEMHDRELTLIGPRGLRLSGGQRQRIAAARALVHRPELVVMDDLSSALDVATEVRLWDAVAAAGLTVIAVSHRQVAFDRADHVIRL
jgi:ATP-binding cassette, subfamily B, bacterial